jgi:hypothetical protein
MPKPSLLSEADGSIPIEPVSIAAQSLNTSPNKLLVTITSNYIAGDGNSVVGTREMGDLVVEALA